MTLLRIALVALAFTSSSVRAGAPSAADLERWNRLVARFAATAPAKRPDGVQTKAPASPKYGFDTAPTGDYVVVLLLNGRRYPDPREASKFFDAMDVPAVRTSLENGIFDIREISFVGDSTMELTCFQPVEAWLGYFCGFSWGVEGSSKRERVDARRETLSATYRGETASALHRMFVLNAGSRFAWTSSDGRIVLTSTANRFQAKIRAP